MTTASSIMNDDRSIVYIQAAFNDTIMGISLNITDGSLIGDYFYLQTTWTDVYDIALSGDLLYSIIVCTDYYVMIYNITDESMKYYKNTISTVFYSININPYNNWIILAGYIDHASFDYFYYVQSSETLLGINLTEDFISASLTTSLLLLDNTFALITNASLISSNGFTGSYPRVTLMIDKTGNTWTDIGKV